MTENEIVYSGIGKRKTSIAKVFLKTGIKSSGLILINEKPLENYFASIGEEKDDFRIPFQLIDFPDKYDILIFVKGGGIYSQFNAIRLAISKSICQINKEYRHVLKKNFLLRRDSRIKERRKYGLKKARKASQYSKR
jgi:small subunit ribosomal protein S9